MSRDPLVALEDILTAISKIESYCGDMDLDAFRADNKTQDAVVRNLEIIGEATKRVPEDIRTKYPDVSWRPAAAMRDFLIHDYPEVDVEAVWSTVTRDLQPLKTEVQKIIDEHGKQE